MWIIYNTFPHWGHYIKYKEKSLAFSVIKLLKLGLLLQSMDIKAAELH